MSSLILTPTNNPENPPSGKLKLFVNATGSLSILDSNGTETPIDASSNPNTAYAASYNETGGTTSNYVIDLTDRPTPADQTLFHFKVPQTNAFDQINIQIAGIGSFPLVIDSSRNVPAGGLVVNTYATVAYDAVNSRFILNSAFLSVELIDVGTSSDFRTLFQSGGLEALRAYRFSHQTSYIYNGAVQQGASESFIAIALSPTTFQNKFYSIANPNDEVYFDFNDPDYNIEINRRIDPIKALSAPFDFRAVRFKRGVDVNGLPTVTDPNSPEYASGSQPVYAFDDNPNGGSCRNILIEDSNVNTSNPDVLVSENAKYPNITFNNVRGAKISGDVRMLSIYNESNIPSAIDRAVVDGAMRIHNAVYCSFVNTAKLDVVNCNLVRAVGVNTTANPRGVNNCRIQGCNNLVLSGVVRDSDFFNADMVSVLDSTLVNISLGDNISLRDANRVRLSNTRNVLALTCSDVTIDNCTYLNLSTVTKSIFEAVVKAIFTNSNFCDVRGLDGFEPADRLGTYVSQAATASNVTIGVQSGVGFTAGELLSVSAIPAPIESDGVPTRFQFDTNNDNLADSAFFSVRRGGQVPATVDNGVFLWTGSVFEYLYTPSTAAPLVVTGNYIKHDYITSNIRKEVLLNVSTLELANSSRDFSQVGILDINHANGAQLTSINRNGGVFNPTSIRRKIRNNAAGVGASLNIQSGSGSSGIKATNEQSLPFSIDSGDEVDVLIETNNTRILNKSTLL